MNKNDYPTPKSQEERYRDYMKDVDKWDKQTGKIDLQDMMVAVSKTSEVREKVESLLSSRTALNIVVEGSATPENNVDAISELLLLRENDGDRVIIFDVSQQAVVNHQKFISQNGLDDKITTVKTSMLSIDLPDNSCDLGFNDCAINYAKDTSEMRLTLLEIKRLLKDSSSIFLLNIAVDHRYDSAEFGLDQELVPWPIAEQTGHFSVLPEIGSEQRQCWTIPFIEKTMNELGFSFIKFDEIEGRNRFALPSDFPISYRRYLLQRLDNPPKQS